MYRLVSLLLIPFFVLGQSLPHSHAGTGVSGPSDHALRPHVHVHGHDDDHDNQHRHADEVETTSQNCQSLSTADHDSDAVYFAASSQSVTRSAGALPVDVFMTTWIVGFVPLPVDTRSRYRTEDPPDRHTTLAIYLLTASLRL